MVVQCWPLSQTLQARMACKAIKSDGMLKHGELGKVLLRKRRREHSAREVLLKNDFCPRHFDLLCEASSAMAQSKKKRWNKRLQFEKWLVRCLLALSSTR